MTEGLEGDLLSIGFYLMTGKGPRVLESVLQSFGGDQIEYVIGATNGDGASDDRDVSAALCRQHGIRYLDRKDAFQPTAAYHFAVSWRWMIHDAAGLIVLRRYQPHSFNGESYVGVTAFFAKQESAEYGRATSWASGNLLSLIWRKSKR